MTVQGFSRDRAGRWVGIVIPIIGVAMLASVFVIGAATFKQVPILLTAPGIIGTGPLLAVVLAQTACLFVMVYAGSLLASKGIELYSSDGYKDET